MLLFNLFFFIFSSSWWINSQIKVFSIDTKTNWIHLIKISYWEPTLLYVIYLFAHIFMFFVCFFTFSWISQKLSYRLLFWIWFSESWRQDLSESLPGIEIWSISDFMRFFLFSNKIDHKNITSSREPKVLVVIFCFHLT